MPLRVLRGTRVEIEPIQGSRFIATLRPAETLEEAEHVLDTLRSEMPDATHHCWAWRALRGGIERCSDDGEPSGTAGRPILARLAGPNILAVVLVVTRYYGGTKLGTGGLVRAYGAAAAAALDAVEQVPHVETLRLRLELRYPHQRAVEQALEAFGASVLERSFTDQVTFLIEVPEQASDDLQRALADATHGQAVVDEAL